MQALYLSTGYRDLGLIDKRNGNPNRNNEAHELVKKKFLETGFNGEKLRETLIADGVESHKIYTERHIYRIVAEYKRELKTVGIDTDQ